MRCRPRWATAHRRPPPFFDEIYPRRSIKAFYQELVLEMAENYNDILAVTNPAFELFLLLHYEGSYDVDIVPNVQQILENRKVNNRRFISQLFSQKSGMNSKTNSAVGKLAANIDVAILQEQNLNQDAEDCIGKLTSNIGKIISDIRSIQDPVQPLKVDEKI